MNSNHFTDKCFFYCCWLNWSKASGAYIEGADSKKRGGIGGGRSWEGGI